MAAALVLVASNPWLLLGLIGPFAVLVAEATVPTGDPVEVRS